jgi:ribosomal protein S26
MPAVFVSGKFNATIPYTTMKMPNRVKICKSIAIFARLQKVRKREQESLDINKSSTI